LSNGNGADALPYRLDRVTGEVVFNYEDREFRLRPTMEATMEVEQALSQGIEMVRTRLVVAQNPFTAVIPQVDPKTTPTTAELGAIICAGIKAAGDRRATIEGAVRMVWQIGRNKIVPAITEFIWACSDGGRLREDDLKNVGSPLEPQPGANGGAATDEIAASMTRELTGSHGASSSA
jgi:hypothetical protein